jgi:hypothetical protein
VKSTPTRSCIALNIGSQFWCELQQVIISKAAIGFFSLVLDQELPLAGLDRLFLFYTKMLRGTFLAFADGLMMDFGFIGREV